MKKEINRKELLQLAAAGSVICLGNLSILVSGANSIQIKTKKMLLELGRHNKKLIRSWRPENDGNLFEKILILENDILSLYNLPPAQEYRDILYFKNCYNVTIKDIESKITKLKLKSNEFFKEHKTPIEILSEGIDNNEDASNIIPKLGLTPHIYNIFLYEKLLITKKSENPIDVYNDMVKAEPFLNDIGVLALAETYEIETYEKLKDKKLKYLDYFFMGRLGKN